MNFLLCHRKITLTASRVSSFTHGKDRIGGLALQRALHLRQAVGCVLLNLKMPFYAVRRGKKPGIYETWGECQEQILKFPGARYKKFATKALAQDFIDGSDNPAEVAMSTGDWTSSCRQKLMELVATFTNCVPDLNKYMNSIPENRTTDAKLLSTFNEAKADMLVCKTTLESLLKCVSGEDTTSKPSTSSKRKHDNNASTAQDTKKQKQIKSHGTGGGSVPVVYTDGACVNNGKSKPQAGIGVYWGPGDKRNLSERLKGKQTNNRAEILAACEAVKQARESGYEGLEIRTDSQFMINCMTQWITGWKKRDWKLSTGGPVKNREELMELDMACQGVNITWTHVKAHSGIDGNEQADNLATTGARKPYVWKTKGQEGYDSFDEDECMW